jgi:hypothetical protein
MSDIDNEELYSVLLPAKNPSVTIEHYIGSQRMHETFSSEGQVFVETEGTEPAWKPNVTDRAGQKLTPEHGTRG